MVRLVSMVLLALLVPRAQGVKKGGLEQLVSKGFLEYRVIMEKAHLPL